VSMGYPIRRILFLGSKRFGLSIARMVHEIAGDRLTGIVTINDAEDVRNELTVSRNLAGKRVWRSW